MEIFILFVKGFILSTSIKPLIAYYGNHKRYQQSNRYNCAHTRAYPNYNYRSKRNFEGCSALQGRVKNFLRHFHHHSNIAIITPKIVPATKPIMVSKRGNAYMLTYAAVGKHAPKALKERLGERNYKRVYPIQPCGQLPQSKKPTSIATCSMYYNFASF